MARADEISVEGYAKNLITFIDHLIVEGAVAFDLGDEITSATLVTHEGEIRNETVRSRLAARP